MCVAMKPPKEVKEVGKKACKKFSKGAERAWEHKSEMDGTQITQTSPRDNAV
jgi:hypothetical protein